MGKKNLSTIAKGGATKNTTTTEKKDGMVDTIEAKKAKAMNRVDELLNETNITNSAKKEILELDSKKIKQVEWLENENRKLSDGYDAARREVKEMKERLKQNESIGVENQITKLFDEIQDNYLRMGKNKYGESNLHISPLAFMNRMIMFFPFLEQRKRF